MMIGRWGAGGWAKQRPAITSAQTNPKIETHTRPQVRTSRQARGGLVLGKLKRCVNGLGLAEHEVPGATVDIDLDSGSFGHLAADDRFCERIFDVLLDRAPELARAVRGVEPLFEQRLLGGP